MKTAANRIALITGASRGLGAAVAKRFAKEGMQVILLGTHLEGLTETDDAIRTNGGSAILVQLDLTDSTKIQELAEMISTRFGKLDILVGNAGLLGEMTPIIHTTPEEWDRTMAVNLTANMQLIRCFDPLLKASDAPRAIFVTSGVTNGVHPYWNAYAVSKAALETLVTTYAAENLKTALKANLVNPGALRTRMRAQAFPGEDPDTLTMPDAATDIFVTLASPACRDTGKIFRAQ